MPRVPDLGDMVDINDHDAAIDALLDMLEQEFDSAVEAYLAGARRGMEVIRDPDLIERLWESLRRLEGRYGRTVGQSAQPDREARTMLRAIRTEQQEIRADFLAEREDRIASERTERAAQRAERQAGRLQRALELREQLDQRQRPTIQSLATKWLIEAHQPEFIALKRRARKHLAEQERQEAATPEGTAASQSG
jgi:hypothetical protein